MITRARWRFWGGYLVSMLVIGLTIYFSIVVPMADKKINASSQSALEKRDKLWTNFGKAAKALNNIRSLQATTPSDLRKRDAEVATSQNDYTTAYNSINSQCQSDQVNLKNQYEVVLVLNALNDALKGGGGSSKDPEIIDLKNQVRTLQAANNTLNQTISAMNRIKQ